jgi:hypothetical protein
VGEVEEVEVKTTKTRRRFAPVLAWNRRVLPRLDAWLLRHTSPKKLAWGGLIVVLTMFTFTWFDGPTKLQLILGGTTFLWAFMWLTVPTVPVGGRVFTTWTGAAARGADPREIIHLQRRGAFVIGTCVIFATVWALYTHDFYTKAYVNFIALGIGTNIAMSQQKLQTEPPRQKASLLSTVICLSVVPVALFGLVVDVYMSIEGASYRSGIFGWLFHLMPELAVRTVVPPCYDFLSLFLVGYVLAGRTNAQGWKRVQLAVKVTASGVGLLIGFILLGGYVGGWLADIYRTGHGELPDQIRQLLAITVITRAPSYLIGGFGAAVISGLGAKASAWVRTRTRRLLRPNQDRIAALEMAMDRANDELGRLQMRLGVPTLKYEIEAILERFRYGCTLLLNNVATSSETMQQLQEIEELLALSNPTPEALLEMGRNLQQMEVWLKAFRGSSTNRLNTLHGQGYVDLFVLLRNYPHFEPWIAEVHKDLKREVEETREKLDAEITMIEHRRNRMHEVWTATMQDLMPRLRDRAEQDARLAAEMEQMLRRR